MKGFELLTDDHTWHIGMEGQHDQTGALGVVTCGRVRVRVREGNRLTDDSLRTVCGSAHSLCAEAL